MAPSGGLPRPRNDRSNVATPGPACMGIWMVAQPVDRRVSPCRALESVRMGWPRTTSRAISVLVATLAACAHTEEAGRSMLPPTETAQTRVGKWIGHSIRDVVQAWGRPTIDLPEGPLRRFEW